MGKYLKMSDVFGDVVTQKLVGDAYEIMSHTYGHVCVVNTAGRADMVAHAINSHDELVELLQAHCKAQYDGANLVREIDVLLNGEDGAAIQASLCDIVAQVKKHGLSFNRVDELVEEVGRLRNHVKNLKSLAAHFAECGGWDVDAYQEYVDASAE